MSCNEQALSMAAVSINKAMHNALHYEKPALEEPAGYLKMIFGGFEVGITTGDKEELYLNKLNIKIHQFPELGQSFVNVSFGDLSKSFSSKFFNTKTCHGRSNDDGCFHVIE